MTTAIANTPRAGLNYWTAYSPPEGSSQPSDPLRFDMYAQRLGNVLLPGITNRTERLRYLSMVCAGIATTSAASSGTIQERRHAFLPFERGWALAMALSVNGELKTSVGTGPSRSLKPEFRGLRGANRVLSHFRTLGGRTNVHPHQYVLLKGQDAQGGLGAYLITLRRFRFVQEDSLELTALGQSLVDAFRPKPRGRRLATLVEDGRVKRTALSALGEELRLGAPSEEEKAIVCSALFEDDRQPVAECLRRMRQARPDSDDPEELLRAIGRPDGDTLERAADYAVAFDPMRISLLQVFTRFGRRLSGAVGSKSLGSLMTDEIEESAVAARADAARLATRKPTPELEAISDLAREVAEGDTVADTIRAAVAFHRREERAWILPDGGDRYSLGHHGPFDEPRKEFNGYTVGRAMQLHADAEATT